MRSGQLNRKGLKRGGVRQDEDRRLLPKGKENFMNLLNLLLGSMTNQNTVNALSGKTGIGADQLGF